MRKPEKLKNLDEAALPTEEELVKIVEKCGTIELDGKYTYYFTPKTLAKAIYKRIHPIYHDKTCTCYGCREGKTNKARD